MKSKKWHQNEKQIYFQTDTLYREAKCMAQKENMQILDAFFLLSKFSLHRYWRHYMCFTILQL